MANIEDLLEKTSRTFALAIPLLPEPTRTQVGIAYLLFRIADTFEDATLWPPGRRREELESFARMLESGNRAALPDSNISWRESPPIANPGYVELLGSATSVFADFDALPQEPRSVIASHVSRSARGMASFVSMMDAAGRLALDSIDSLRAYCFPVAGIVGEMLTELFLLGGPGLDRAAKELRARAATFGEALQLVNVLKDARDDRSDGRSYLKDSDRPTVFELARKDLAIAAEYIATLEEFAAPRGFLDFTALPVALASATLAKVEREGPGAKVSRPEVAMIRWRVKTLLDRGAVGELLSG